MTAPPSKPETLNAKLDRLACVIADEALAALVPLADRIEAMKVLSTYRVGIGKLKDRGADDEPSAVGTMSDMRRSVEETEDE
jgi:hypothetical protein